MLPPMRTSMLCLALGILAAATIGCATKTSMTATETPATSDEAIAEMPDQAQPEAETPEAMEAPAEPAETEEAPSPVGMRDEPQLAAPSLTLSTMEEEPAMPTSEPDDEVVVLETDRGRIVIELYPGDAPKHVENFKKLTSQRFYSGAARTFHRYVAGFVIQGGDPKGDGTGGPGYTIPAELKRKHVKGAVASARLPDNVNPQKESNGSQFYICLDDLPQLDGDYSVFGQVVQGMDAVVRLRISDEVRNASVRARADVVK